MIILLEPPQHFEPIMPAYHNPFHAQIILTHAKIRNLFLFPFLLLLLPRAKLPEFAIKLEMYFLPDFLIALRLLKSWSMSVRQIGENKLAFGNESKNRVWATEEIFNEFVVALMPIFIKIVDFLPGLERLDQFRRWRMEIFHVKYLIFEQVCFLFIKLFVKFMHLGWALTRVWKLISLILQPLQDEKLAKVNQRSSIGSWDLRTWEVVFWSCYSFLDFVSNLILLFIFILLSLR